MKLFKKLNTEDRGLNMIQDNITTALNPLLQGPLADAKVIANVALATGTNTIDHKLGRALVGWVVCRTSAAITLYDTQASNLLADKNLKLVASGPATVSLLVF